MCRSSRSKKQAIKTKIRGCWLPTLASARRQFFMVPFDEGVFKRWEEKKLEALTLQRYT